MREDTTTKKSAPENEETIRDVLDTFNEKQRLVLYYLVGKAVKDANGRENEARKILGRILDILGG